MFDCNENHVYIWLVFKLERARGNLGSLVGAVLIEPHSIAYLYLGILGSVNTQNYFRNDSFCSASSVVMELV